jgi:hypothetical protein
MAYPLSSNVSAGDATLSAHYNNLRSDALLLGQPSADVINLAALLERYESRLTLERLSTDQVRVPASATAPVSLIISGFMVQAVANVDLQTADKPAGAAADYYIFANRAAGSTTFTLTVSTSITEAANQRRIGRFYWNGTLIVKDSVVTELAVLIKSLLYFVEPQTCNGRLTLSTGVSVTPSDVSSSASLYFTPHNGNRIALYAQSYGWRLYAFSELTLDISGVSADKNLDIWIYDNAGTLTLAYTQWSNNTLRATALVRQDGVYVKTGALGYRYLGTIRTSAAGASCDTKLARFVWNYYNQCRRSIYIHDSTANWTYGTRTVRAWGNTAANRAEFVIGLDLNAVQLNFMASANPGAMDLSVGIGLDSTSTKSGDSTSPVVTSSGYHSVSATYCGFPGIGFHYLQLLETGGDGSNVTFYGVPGGAEGKSAAAGYILG